MNARDVLEKLACDRTGCPCRSAAQAGKGNTHCPAHGDQVPSLSVEAKAGRVLVHCFAGCPQDAVLAALERRGLGLRRPAGQVRPAKRDRHETRYKVCTPDGAHVATHVRIDEPGDGKRIHWTLPDGRRGLGGVQSSALPLYRSEAAARKPSAPVVICEGEKAAEALAALEEAAGVTALGTVTGASSAPAPEALGWLSGRIVYLWPDHDPPGAAHMQRVAANLRKAGVEDVRVVAWNGALEPGDDAADFVARGGTAEELLGLLAAAAAPPEDEAPAGWGDWREAAPYRETPRGIVYDQPTREGTVEVTLTNFCARVIREEVFDDGADRQVRLVIAGHKGTQQLRPLIVPAARFPGLSWALEWGTGCVVKAGMTTRDRVREAVQLLSGDPPRVTTYGHTGWREVDGRMVYLHGGGAIGDGGHDPSVAVRLDSRLRAFVLPAPPDGEELQASVRAALGLLEAADRRVSLPLLAAVSRAPLGAAGLSLFLAGRTGTRKTSLAAVVQAFFGADWAASGLVSWETTDNALERLAALARDAVLVVDDFVPRDPWAAAALHRRADRVIRGAANRSGRQRMRADGTLAPEYTPEALIVGTGEDFPTGESLRARMLVLEVAEGTVDLGALSRLQQHAREGTLARAMAGYLRWLAPRIAGLRADLWKRTAALREEAAAAGFRHPRTAETVAGLMAGLEQLAAFAADCGALSPAEADALLRGGWEALLAAGAGQAEHLSDADPVGRWLGLLWAAIAAGRAHVADVKGGAPREYERWGWRPAGRDGNLIGAGDCIGWLEGDVLLLEPEASFAAVQRLAREQGEPLAVTRHALHKRLAERRLITPEAAGGRTYYTPRRSVAGQRRRVLILPLGRLMSQDVASVASVARTRAESAPAPAGHILWPQLGPGESKMWPENVAAAADAESGEAPAGHTGHTGHIPGDKTPLAVAEPPRSLEDPAARRALSLAESAGWPRLQVFAHLAAGPGEESWKTFVQFTDAKNLRQALALLEARFA
ncbi:MAG: hypothetical protein KatS3mg062_0008 [Tepidiforma sp.]|nr:MAG: hypothetical protein KatS3mg062_0008 [Tepidiforma sp.]